MGQLIELVKADGLKSVGPEEGTLNYTLMYTNNMMGPLPKDDVTVQWYEVYKDIGAWNTHKGGEGAESDLVKKMKPLLKSEGKDDNDMAVLQFPGTKLYAK